VEGARVSLNILNKQSTNSTIQNMHNSRSAIHTGAMHTRLHSTPSGCAVLPKSYLLRGRPSMIRSLTHWWWGVRLQAGRYSRPEMSLPVGSMVSMMGLAYSSRPAAGADTTIHVSIIQLST
jgi:hypothetical protein